MGMYLNLGNDGFRAVRKSTYVDKTGLITYVNSVLGTKEKLICVSRPRRFGKSFAAQMLCAYYDRSCDSRALFEDLEIGRDPSFEEYLNQYDVIYLDITLFIALCGDIKRIVPYIQEQVAGEIGSTYPEAAGETSLPMALSKASEAAGSRFVVIIDEWDALFREAKEDADLQKEYIQLLRGLFKSSLTDRTIEAVYMTGILPIKKYGTQSAMTDFREYTMLRPDRLAEYVGFTADEVKELCSRYEMDYEKTKSWYDGYYFHEVGAVYNPNSVMQAMMRKKFRNYWTQTETYESLKLYIDMDFDGLKSAVLQMLSGSRCSVDTGLFQNDMTSVRSRDDVLTLLVHLGYLACDEELNEVFIPNEEIRHEFYRAVKCSRHSEMAELVKTSDQLLRDTLALNGAKVAEAIERVHRTSLASVFYNNEQALRSVIRFAYISCIEQFQEIQELTSGNGYADVVYLPMNGSAMPVMVVELKWNKEAHSAIRQIKDRNYPQVLEGYGSEILLVGISYDEKAKKHTCFIEKWNKGT